MLFLGEFRKMQESDIYDLYGWQLDTHQNLGLLKLTQLFFSVYHNDDAMIKVNEDERRE